MRTIATIAREIGRTWQKPFYGAVPYLRAMHDLDDMSSRYFEDSAVSVVSYFLANANTWKGEDSAVSVVSYFLANANTWKGEDARRIKSELKDMLAAHRTARVEV